MKAETNAWDRNCSRITMASSQQQQPCGRYVYWSDMETLALLSIIEGMGVVSQLDAKRQRNAHIFEAARVQMARRGFFRPIQQIRYRWKTLKSLYHKQKAAAAAGECRRRGRGVLVSHDGGVLVSGRAVPVSGGGVACWVGMHTTAATA
ncbi:uncharacterized protein LOC144949514 [Lampetra fluviatilis]